MTKEYAQETIEKLMDEELEWDKKHEILSSYKDDDRFQKYRDILQERVDWDDPIILPYTEHLYVVAKPDDRWIIKCDCGHEFCEHDENWKREALIRVRDTEEEMQEIYPSGMHADPEWQELREFFCPDCKTLLEVSPVLPWYPPIHTFEPDIETFYGEWIEESIPTVE